MKKIGITTPAEGMMAITGEVAEAVRESGIRDGMCLVFVPHTTAAVTVNENADPDVVADLRKAVEKFMPELPWLHGEGNSPAHVKSSLIGCSVVVPVASGMLALGQWQGIYFWEFDGPRKRQVWITVTGR